MKFCKHRLKKIFRKLPKSKCWHYLFVGNLCRETKWTKELLIKNELLAALFYCVDLVSIKIYVNHPYLRFSTTEKETFEPCGLNKFEGFVTSEGIYCYNGYMPDI